MKIKNINPNIGKKIAAFVLVGTLAVTSLVGCGNMDMWDTQYTFNQVIVINGDVATIVDVKQWGDYDGEQIQFITPEGLVFIANSDNIYPLDTRNSKVSAEEMARSLVGEDGEINYLNPEKNKTK